MRRTLLVGLVAVTLGGCFHATVETGLTPAPAEVYEDGWADSWIFGLVPPSTVEVEEECSNGVAVVETKLSFLNQLVGWLTSYIYTPMAITVTCAQDE